MERDLDGLVVQPCGGGGVGGFGGEQVPEGFVVVDAADVFVGDVNAGEHGLVQAPADFVGGVSVELIGVLEEGEAGFEVAGAFAQVDLDSSELAGDAFAFGRDLVETLLDLRFGNVGVGEQVEQVLFVDVELV